MLLSIDPGRNTGFAIFDYEGGELVDCGICDPSLKTLYQFFDKWVITRVVAEIPQIYRRHQSKGDPNDLVPLSVECGIIKGMAFCAGGPERDDGTAGIEEKDIDLVRPARWKGQLPKHVTCRDVQRLLSSHERELLGPTPTGQCNGCDDWDAVGIGLYKLNELGIREGWVRGK